ncbi:MAG: response regulator [Deltaproteobacteria bacterium]|nr:response regulator [Deltaproteobacteria bacterium]MBW2084907.1 response regulator [Deltaproteobacteria bacterium]
MEAAADILIIEDDKDLVNSLRIILEDKKYNVRAGYNGKEGFGEIEKKTPDLILLDVMMATDTEGFDLAYKLRNNPKYKDIPIIMITSFVQKMAEIGPEKFQHILGESWPVSHILEKPIEPEKLLSVIKDFLQ